MKDGLIRIEQRNKFSVGETIEIMKPDGRNVEAKVVRIGQPGRGRTGKCTTSEADPFCGTQ